MTIHFNEYTLFLRIYVIIRLRWELSFLYIRTFGTLIFRYNQYFFHLLYVYSICLSAFINKATGKRYLQNTVKDIKLVEDINVITWL